MRTSRQIRSVAATLALVLLSLSAGCAIAPPQTTPASTTSAPPVVASQTATPSEQPTIVPPVPTPAVLAAELAKISHKGIKSTGMVVLDPTTGASLASKGDAALVPASTMKVLTSLTAVDTLGPDATFTTRVVSPKPGSLVLVGGGDPMLTDKPSKSDAKRASLAALADQTVAALKASGTKAVRLGYDASLFVGPAWNPSWKKDWKVYTARVSALTVNGGRTSPWQAQGDPAKAAAQAFAERLQKAGIKVTGIAPTKANADAAVMATVVSAPLSQIVGFALLNSDNFVAEVVARQAAIGAGRAASFAGAAATVSAWLDSHGLWFPDMAIADGSGLSSRSRIRPSTLAQAIALALSTPKLAAVPAGFPVAGVSGTLKTRFNDKSEKAGRQVVHAKTGTLAGVASLAGYVTTADGATLVFAAMANQAVGRNTAYNWLDRTAAVLARCGCQAVS